MIFDYLSLTAYLVPDEAGRLEPAQIDYALASAVLKYSAARPRSVVVDVVADGSRTLALPAAWVPGFSRVDSIETPVGNIPPTLLEKNSFQWYQGPTAAVILLASALAAGAAVRLAITAPHLLADADDTIPPVDREAVAKYAAALLCDQLAAFYANDTDATIQAGMAPGQTRSQAYAARARDYRKQFQEAIGAVAAASLPGCAVVGLGSGDAAGQPYLFHPPRRLR